MKKSFFSMIACASMAAMMLFSSCGSSTDSNSSKSDANNAAASDTSFDKVKDAGKLVLGLDATFKPMGYTDENNNVVGFDIDLAQEVCKRLDIKLETKGVVWETKEIDLDAGTIDCIWNGLSISDKRKEVMLMSDPYMENEMIFTVNDNSGIKTLDDLKGKKVTVQNGSTAQEILEASDIAKDINITALETNVEALSNLEMNMCDAVFLDSVVAKYEINTSKKAFRILDEGLEPEQYGIGFRLDDKQLCDKIYGTLKEMKADGTVEEIATKWFGSDITCIK